MIPEGSVIRSASIDLTAGNVSGNPFKQMGQLYICHQQYGTLKSNDFVAGPATAVMYSSSQLPTDLVGSSLIVAAVQEQVDAGGDRFQIRLQFVGSPVQQLYPERWSQVWLGPSNYIEFPQAQTKLVIEYDD
jgi:hypothetical protein